MTLVAVSKNGVFGELVLNGPKTLNALRYEDIVALTTGLRQHECDPSVRAIVIRSSNARAFCAGGDMKQIREHVLSGQFDMIEAYFTAEYALNLAISRCKKPYIALMHGIAMGGGLGVSVHGSARVVTETSMLSMPESRIGFFPDVGASYFLPKLAQRSGYWLGLTAASIKGYQAVSVGLATHCVNSERLEELRSVLADNLMKVEGDNVADWHESVKNTLDAFNVGAPEDDFANTMAQRQSWFADDDLIAIRARLAGAARGGNEDAQQLLTRLDDGSPYAALVTIQLLQDTAGKDLETCLQHELALCAEAVRHPDCVEGIRAVLVDKDRKPRWA